MVERALQSLGNLDLRLEDDAWDSVARLITSTAHLGPEVWAPTYKTWSQSLFAQTVDDYEYVKFQRLFGGFLSSGNWEKALLAAQQRPETYKPWVVVASGISGIRKKHSIMQPWFRILVDEAIGNAEEWAAAKQANANATEQRYFLSMKPELPAVGLADLCDCPRDSNPRTQLEPTKLSSHRAQPTRHVSLPRCRPRGADDSFFLQMSPLIARLANEELDALYSGETSSKLADGADGGVSIRIFDLQSFTAAKAHLWNQFRTYAQMVAGIALAKATTLRMNVIIEDHGFDTSTINYLDCGLSSCPFSSANYRRLFLHFEPSGDLSVPRKAIDKRLGCEMADGRHALKETTIPAKRIEKLIGAVRGGALASRDLQEARELSYNTWLEVLHDDTKRYAGWRKAVVAVHPVNDASDRLKEASWTMHAPRHSSAPRLPIADEPIYTFDEKPDEVCVDPDHGMLISPPSPPGFPPGKAPTPLPPNDAPFDIARYLDFDARRFANDPAYREQWLQAESSKESLRDPLEDFVVEWRKRIGGWWMLAAPGTNLGDCVGALGMHLSSRLDAFWRLRRGGASAPPPASLQISSECEWIISPSAEKPPLPDIPDFPDGKIPDPWEFDVPPLIPMPRLLPPTHILLGGREGGLAADGLTVDGVLEDASTGVGGGRSTAGPLAAGASIGAMSAAGLVFVVARMNKRPSSRAATRRQWGVHR